MPTATTNRFEGPQVHLDMLCWLLIWWKYFQKGGKKVFFWCGPTQISSKNPKKKKKMALWACQKHCLSKGKEQHRHHIFFISTQFYYNAFSYVLQQIAKTDPSHGGGGERKEGELNKFLISRHSRELKSSSSIKSPTWLVHMIWGLFPT